VVSHERYFLNRVCTGILAFEGDGVVQYAVGNYDYYLEKRSAGGGRPPPVDPAPALPNERSRAVAKPRKLKWKEERELEGMEAAILAAEDEVVRLEAIFSAPDFYTTHASDWQKLEAELSGARDKVAQLYERWAELGAIAGPAQRAAD
jgi:ATP-binding cassette subfamily F protein uup